MSTRIRRGAVTLLAGVLAVLTTPLVVSGALPQALAAGSALTVTGPDKAYDPVTGKTAGALPSATVDQTANVIDQVVHVTWTGETSSLDGNFNYGGTNVATRFNPLSTAYAVGVYECKGAAPASFDDCFNVIAGSSGNGGLGNAVQTLTFADGTGFADLHVETGVSNSQLGCSQSQACSVAVVPAWGGRPARGSTAADCNDHSLDLHSALNPIPPDVLYPYDIGNQACSWANRMVLPLSFAPTPSNCPSATPAFTATGSPMLERAMSQWQGGWCRDRDPLDFSYDSTSDEYEARTSFAASGGAFSSATDVALTTQSAGGKPSGYTYAPIANTGIVVAFLIDDPKTHRLIPSINLDAELVAKLLTQSYAPLAFSCNGVKTKPAVQSATCDPAVYGNPQSLLTDPQFLALNPDLTAQDFPYNGQNAFGAFFPTVLAGNSDLTYELTRWIAADPAAKAFLAGKADAGGMHVNDYYEGVTYPTSQLNELDPGYTNPAKDAPAGNGTMQNAWQPVSGLDRVGTLLVGGTATALNPVPPACALPPCSLGKLSELYGTRSLFAILDQGQAAAYDFPVASLTNAAGDSVPPSTTSITATVARSTVNSDGITRQTDLSSTAPGAYPLTVTDYAMVHTCKQSRATATAVANMLGKVATSQTAGLTPGTLAPGYVPLTTTQQAQLAIARTAVTANTCAAVAGTTVHRGSSSTSGSGGASGSSGGHGSGGSGGGSGSGSGDGGSGTGDANGTGGTGGAAATGSGSDSAGAGTGASAQRAVGTSGVSSAAAGSTNLAATEPTALRTTAETAGAARFALPVLLIVGGLLVLGGPAIYLLLGTGAGAGLAGWVKGLRP